MKEIIFEQKLIPVVSIKDISSRSFIGVQFVNGTKSLMFYVSSNSDNYWIAIGPNGYMTDEQKTKAVTLADYKLVYPKATFYSFDTAKELMEWVAK